MRGAGLPCPRRAGHTPRETRSFATRSPNTEPSPASHFPAMSQMQTLRISIKCGGFLLRLPSPHLTSSLEISGNLRSRFGRTRASAPPAWFGPASGRTTPPCVRAGRTRAPASEAQNLPAVGRVSGASGAALLSLRLGVRMRGSLMGSGPEDAEAEVEGDAPQ